MRSSAAGRWARVFTLAAAPCAAALGCGGNDISGIGFGASAGSSPDASLDAKGGQGGATGASGAGHGGASGTSGAGNGGASGSRAGAGGVDGGALDVAIDTGARGGTAGIGGAGGTSGTGGAEGGVGDVAAEGAAGAGGAGGTGGAEGGFDAPDVSNDAPLDTTDGGPQDVAIDRDAGICAVDNEACSNGGSNGLCKAHACAACVDGPAPTGDDGNCSSAYNGAFLCLGGMCTPGDCRTSTDCTLSTNGPLCHVAQPNFCGKCTTDAQCLALGSTAPICNTTTGLCVASTASCLGQADNTQCSINSADVCCGSICSFGDCCPGSAGDQLCKTRLGNNSATCSAGHQCTTCDAVSGLTFLVDPVDGDDGVATGSGTSGGQGNAGCAFKTITRALQAIGASPGVGTVVQVTNTGPVSAASNGETFPINVTTHVTITAAGGSVTITPSASQVAFVLASAGSGLDGTLGGGSIVIDGGNHTAYDGVAVTAGATAATTLQNITVQNFLREGIRVGSTGALTIKQGVTVTQSGTSNGRRSGLLVTGNAHVDITVPAGQDTTAFNDNTQHGIQVDGAASVTIAGSLSGTTGTIECRDNAVAGLAIGQNPGISVPANIVDGFLSFGSTQGNGVRVEGGSNVKIRNSASLGNNGSGIAIAIVTSVVGGNRVNSLANIDLGKPSDPGNNTWQASGGQDPNQGAGICLQVDQTAGTLSAQGNVFSGGKNCATTAASLSFNSGNCNGGRDLGLAASGGGSTTGNDIDVAQCTHP